MDSAAWRAIEDGAALTWPTWFGHPDGAVGYLTRAGVTVAARAAAWLEEFFGPTWLDRAVRPGGREVIYGLGGQSPVWVAEGSRQAAFVDALIWWASLEVLSSSKVPGFATMRRDVRRDITTHRFRHTLAQARLAAMGAYLGGVVELEPAKSHGPGDVLIRFPAFEVFIEVVTFGVADSVAKRERDYQTKVEHLMVLAARQQVDWNGTVPGPLGRAEEQQWLAEVTAVAERCAETQSPAATSGPWEPLVAKATPSGGGSVNLEGPDIAHDVGRRLAGVAGKKGEQTQQAGTAWVWIEEHGGTHIATPFARLGLEQKLAAMSELLRPTLTAHPHLGGIVWSQGARYSITADETVEHRGGIAMSRALPGGHSRHTILVNRRLVLPEQTRLMAALTGRESHWLDWALGKLGAPPLSALFAPPSPQQPKLRRT